MIKALEEVFPINIVSGLHFGLFKMSRENSQAKYLNDGMFAAASTPKAAKRRRLLLPNNSQPESPF